MKRTIGLVQCDSTPEEGEKNLASMERLTEEAVGRGAEWVVFHENTILDYTPRVASLAEPVPKGASTKRVEKLARDLRCHISFGLSEREGDRHHITQVFVSPTGFVYRYRKTWLWRSEDDKGYRDEWARYDPGDGPETFYIDGVKATCFICADGESRRCIERAAALRPRVVFYPNNRASLPSFDLFGQKARQIGAPLLVTNRVGRSWIYECSGGCVFYSPEGKVLAKANREGREEILIHDLDLPSSF